ncbi:tRNA lysidine(34) synthetase TilS, partial [Corallococcus terminator]
PGVLEFALGKETAWPLTVRSRKAGDRVRTRSGHRKLQDVLVDARVPAEARDAQPVVVDADGGVLWLPGVLASVVDRREVASRHSLWASPPVSSERERRRL